MKKTSVLALGAVTVLTVGICLYGEFSEKKEVAQYEATFKTQQKVKEEQYAKPAKTKEKTEDEATTKAKVTSKPKIKVKKTQKEKKKDPADQEALASYTIQNGDDLNVLASKMGISTNELMKINHWASLPIVQPGQNIQVPAKALSAIQGQNNSRQGGGGTLTQGGVTQGQTPAPAVPTQGGVPAPTQAQPAPIAQATPAPTSQGATPPASIQ